MAAFFARAFFEFILAIGTYFVESAVAGSDEVGSGVVGLSAGAGSMDACLLIANLIFGDFDGYLEGKGGQFPAFLLRT